MLFPKQPLSQLFLASQSIPIELYSFFPFLIKVEKNTCTYCVVVTKVVLNDTLNALSMSGLFLSHLSLEQKLCNQKKTQIKVQ